MNVPLMKRGQMLSTMLMLMAERHAGQFDRGGQPYALHPMKVMYLLKTTDEELQCIALGHDLVEDTKTTFRELLDIGMSPRVVEAIRCLTKMPGQTYEEYQEGIYSNEDAMRVKLCDLRHNSDLRRLKGVSEKDLERSVKYQKFYYEINEKLKQK